MKPVISIIMGSKFTRATMQSLKSSITLVSLTKRKLFPHTAHQTMFKHAEEARSQASCQSSRVRVVQLARCDGRS